MLTAGQGRGARVRGARVREALVWGALGVATAIALTVPVAYLMASSGGPTGGPEMVSARPVAVMQTVSSVHVDSMGADVIVTTARVAHVVVTETFGYPPGAGPSGPVPGRGRGPGSGPAPVPAPPGAVTSVAEGTLTVRDPGCADEESCVRFALQVPPGTAVSITSDGGSVWVSGTAGTYVDSAGGIVHATGIDGRLTIVTGNGDAWIDGVTGVLHADTAGGNSVARNISAPSAVVSTGNGDAWLAFTSPASAVTVTTDGGDATLRVPGGPYAVTASSDSGAETLRVPVNPTSPRTITISTGGGALHLLP